MRILKSLLCLLIVISSVGYAAETSAASEPNGILTLGEALALTLMHNPELKVFSLETRAAQARELQAGLRPNPELGIEVENIGGRGELSGVNSAETTIQLGQLIELGGKLEKRKRVASFEKELAGVDYQNKKLEVFSEATKTFISVLKAQEKFLLSQELLMLSEESFATVGKRVQAGKDSPIEEIRASVAHANIKISHLESQRELEYARKKLASFWGQNNPLFQEAAGNLDSVEQLPVSENLISRLQLNPEYARWKIEIQKSQAALDLEKSKAISDITIVGGVRRFNETDENAFVVGFSVPLPIFDRNQGGKQEAFYNLLKAREEQTAALLRLQNEFNAAYLEFTNSYSQSVSLKNEVLPGATKMFDAAKRAYEEGKMDYLNVLDAQRTFFDVKNEYIENLADYHSSRTDIERFIGKEIESINNSESEQ
ncbi:MAG: hypothetical protein A2Y10_15470 [Planctomycetes bacterium GWF2_41_51]|nr:MAG: hypothetical protein A2Y10_15470 [Planctomycetes bacterium GWF2_41_51]HBG27564.1 TolC family protein [Phycisphaerales bacterium]